MLATKQLLAWRGKNNNSRHGRQRPTRQATGFAPLQGTHVQALQIVISGMAQGCIYGLIALGLVLIYKTTETVSFAHGELMMLGAFAGFACMTLFGWPFWIAILATVVVMALFGFGLERIVIRPILGQPAFS